jgi:outer membrane protein
LRTITDTHEAKARFDLSAAQEIAAQNDSVNKRRALKQLTGGIRGLKPCEQMWPAPPNPASGSWADLAEKKSYPVLIQEALIETQA